MKITPNSNHRCIKQFVKKVVLFILIVVCNPIHAQADINKELSKLFLNLKLELVPEKMMANSNLTFEKFIKDIPEFGDKATIFLTEFTENKAIESKIVAGEIQITQKNSDIKYGKYEVTQSLKFQTLEELLQVYNKLSEQYEALGRYSKTHTNEDGDEYFVKHINKTITIEDKSKSILLNFSYSVPRNKETGYHLFIGYRL